MKVLIVEDDFYSRRYISDLLALEKYEVFTAKDGEEGLKLFKEHKPHIIISDIQMPKMNGLEMLEKIRKIQSETIVIITTAFGSEEFAIQALRLGANNYLKKPIHEKDLIPLLLKYKSILHIGSKTIENYGQITSRNFTIEFETQKFEISMMIDRLMNELDDGFNDTDKINIELGLLELIINAVEHGNLGISYDEKNQALNADAYDKLLISRKADPNYGMRKIIIDYKFDCSGCEWIISDEGCGFDYNSLPDPTSDGNLLELNGRGIFITRFLFDELEYLGIGNMVRVKKYFTSLE